VSVVAEVTDEIVRRTLPNLVEAADAMDPARLMDGARMDLSIIERAGPAVEQAADELASADRRLASLQTPVLGRVSVGLARVRKQVMGLADATDSISIATRLLPPMLGAQEPRRYLVAVLSPAEARGTGGFLSAYGVVVADEGTLRLRRLASNAKLGEPLPEAPITIGAEYSQLYGDEARRWVNGNLSPHFPYAGEIWSAHFQRQFGQRVDGVLTVDPFMLGALLDVTGPVTLPDGTRVTGSSAPDLVMKGVYERFPDEASYRRRDAYLILLGRTVIERLLSGEGDPRQILTALVQSTADGRLRLWSRRPAEQRVLEPTSLAGSVPATAAPYFSVVVNNGGGNKLDYYLGRRVEYRLGSCTGGRRVGTARIAFTNHAPARGVPSYVLGRELTAPRGEVPARGTNRLLVYVFATRGARLTGGELDGGVLEVVTGRERGHPVFAFTLDLAPGETRTVELEIDEPASAKDPILSVQPLAREQHSVVTSSVCRT